MGGDRRAADSEGEHGPKSVSGKSPSARAPTPTPTPTPSQGSQAIVDIVRGMRDYHLWGLLAWQDIRQRYRRSTIGPFWLTISMGALVGGLGMLYAGLFRVQVADYLPFVAAGFVLWGFVSGVINEGCTAFIDAAAIIKQMRLPLSVHVFRVVWRNLIIMAHNVVIYFVVAVVFSVWPGWTGLLAVPGLVLLALNGVWIGMLFGVLSARFRDVPQIAASVVQVAFFLTPIIWKPEQLPERALVLQLNPFFHALELVRAPLLGQVPGTISWITTLAVTGVGWVLTLVIYRRYRWRIAYWV